MRLRQLALFVSLPTMLTMLVMASCGTKESGPDVLIQLEMEDWIFFHPPGFLAQLNSRPV